MKRYRCDMRVKRTARVIVFIIFILLLWVAEYFLIDYPFIMWPVVTAISAIAVFMWFVYIEKYFNGYEVVITNNAIKRRSGFFFYKESIMPLNAVQYTTMVNGKIFSKIGLRGVNVILVFAYGGMMYLPFLSVANTEEIKAFLDRYINGEEGDLQEDNTEFGKMGDIDIEI